MRFRSFEDTTLEADGISACSDIAEAFLVDGFSKHGSGGGSVTGDVGSLGGDLLDELCSHIFVGISRARFPWRRSHRPWSRWENRIFCR